MFIVILTALILTKDPYVELEEWDFGSDLIINETKRKFDVNAADVLFWQDKLNKKKSVFLGVCEERILITDQNGCYEIPLEKVEAVVFKSGDAFISVNKCIINRIKKKLCELYKPKVENKIQYLVISYRNNTERMRVLTFYAPRISKELIESLEIFIMN
ncbi:hypothetical protein [Alkalibacter mobilis]|uniref:hypothetical protein n=1 Tax=Alkalibacter mobilis TaxID=2787712 RepID=UPI0018A08ABF|nr:hypothetical protein [Alkalibacter mobilis]